MLFTESFVFSHLDVWIYVAMNAICGSVHCGKSKVTKSFESVTASFQTSSAGALYFMVRTFAGRHLLMSVCSNSRRCFSLNLSPDRFFMSLKTGIGSVTGAVLSQVFIGIGSFGSGVSSQKAGALKIIEIMKTVKGKFFKGTKYIVSISRAVKSQNTALKAANYTRNSP